MTRLTVGPFNRVEGDLEVSLELEDGRVKAAQVNAPMYRGFEQILHGKDPADALVIAPRICGICSVSQSAAAARTLAAVMDLEMPANGETVFNLLSATENVADHFTHFYLFFMPDFARDVYRDEPWFAAVAPRFRAGAGSAVEEALRARARFMHVMGMLGGKWPHTLSLQPGGVTRAVESGDRLRLRTILAEFRHFLESRTFGDRLEQITALDSAEALYAWAAGKEKTSDFSLFLQLADALLLQTLGRWTERFMSYGHYVSGDRALFERGLWEAGAVRPLDLNAVTEDVSFSWLRGGDALHPREGVTLPDADKAQAYTWCKAPRLSGATVEVGALARQMVNGHPLIRALVAESGANVRNRVIARLLEIALVVQAMETWLGEIQAHAPYCHHAPLPSEGEGAGLVEAARGSLGHWLRVHNGRVLNYQIIAPTTWNFSPRDADGLPGPLEQALIGAPVRPGEREPIAVQHIVRSFDPCMVCTVH